MSVMNVSAAGVGADQPALMQALGHAPGDRRVQVLREIARCGSISQAARAVGVSYKAAWQAIDTLGNLAGVPVVQKSVGGAGGGGARLTEAGHALLRAAQAMAQARGVVLQQLQTLDGPPVQAAQQLAVQTSMRNQWPCVVQQVQVIGALAQVHLQLCMQWPAADQAPSPVQPGVATLAATSASAITCRITAESAQLLSLKPGLSVLAMCKATAVQVFAARKAPQGVGNLWPAKAVRVSTGDWGDEVSAQAGAGWQLVGFAAAGSGLRAGRAVYVHVPEAAVVLVVV